jgi:hypothetical protein
MFVWVLSAKRPGVDLYIVGVFGTEAYANEHASRYMRRHPAAEVLVQRFAVINGRQS